MADMKTGREARITRGVYQNEDVVFIQLTQGYRAIVGADVWPRIERDYGRRWLKNGDGRGHVYARKEIRDEVGERKLITLARAVMHAGPGERVEVMNGDALDCRRSNLHKLETAAALKRRREYAEKRERHLAAQRGEVAADDF